MRSSDPSRHAQLGALEVQMFATGLIEDGSSSVPTRTTIMPGYPDVSANRWHPHCGQKRRRTRLPLPAFRRYSQGDPVISIALAGKSALAVPFPAMR